MYRTKLGFSLCRYVIECPNCSVIYRSRQYWYGNQDPVDTVVRTEIQHVWPGVRVICCLSHLSIFKWQKEQALFTFTCLSPTDSWRTITTLRRGCWMVWTYMAQSVSELSVKPAKAVTAWLTDQIAPAYWKPNSLILVSFNAWPF